MLCNIFILEAWYALFTINTFSHYKLQVILLLNTWNVWKIKMKPRPCRNLITTSLLLHKKLTIHFWSIPFIVSRFYLAETNVCECLRMYMCIYIYICICNTIHVIHTCFSMQLYTVILFSTQKSLYKSHYSYVYI